jgi:hypothetical protein
MSTTEPLDIGGVAVVHVRDVPDELHRELRKLGIDRSESLRTIVIRALERERDRMRAEAEAPEVTPMAAERRERRKR